MGGWKVVIGLLGLLGVQPLAADVLAITPDGRRVVLKEDKTWEYAQEAAEPGYKQVELHLTRMEALPNACRLGLKLNNTTDVTVKSLVPQLSAFSSEHARFETVFVGFTNIRPTGDQYREARFSGIRCADIAYIKVHGADRCSVGEDLTRFSTDKGECLRHIRVLESPLIAIFKDPDA